MTSVAEIAAEAFTAVAADITGVIQAVTITRTAQGAYNPATGGHAITTSTQTGRALLDGEKPVADIFPDHIRGPRDQLWLIEGITSLHESDVLTIGAADWAVSHVQDIVGAGQLFYCLAQVKP